LYTLYCRRSAGSAAVEALLALCAAPHRLIDLERGPDGSFPEDFRAINPRAEVPTLLLPDGEVMTESAAMMIHLADIHPAAGLSPPVLAPERPRFLRWICYLATTVYMSDLRYYYPERFTNEADGAGGIREMARAAMTAELALYGKALGAGPFLLGERMSSADVYAAMLVSWHPDVAALFASHPILKDMCEAVTRRPEVARVWARNGM
jgi:glutathione S-transferase/GST-like protein